MRELENYADGDWTDATGPTGDDVVNPATGETVATLNYASADDLDAVVDAANEAFETWRQTPVEERIQPLFRYKHLLEEHQESLAETLVEEHGKTKKEAMGELRRGIENVEVACGMPSMLQAGHLPHAAPGIDETAVRRPLGTYAAITPFNFPGMIPLWFMPYAVAAGNAFLLKPSEKTPVTAQRLVELADEAGFPDGVISLVNGGPDTVNGILAHDGITGVSFVGSTPVAKHVYETAAKHGKRVQAQGGAKNHILVADSADLDFAAEQTVSSAFANTGQRCLANPVAVVADAVYDEFAQKVADVASEMTVAPGLDDDSEMGPLITPEHRQRVLDYIATGVEEGATLVLDGRDHDAPSGGNFLGPTVFADVKPDDTIAREEIFGPVLALIRAADLDDAIAVAQASDYGNAASLFTDRGADARKFRNTLDAGNLGVNVGTAAPMAFFHFGGRKDSFFGDLHAQGDDMVKFYTDEHVYIERWPDGE